MPGLTDRVELGGCHGPRGLRMARARLRHRPIILAVVISLPLRVLDVNVYASAGVVAILTFAYGAAHTDLHAGQTFGMRSASALVGLRA